MWYVKGKIAGLAGLASVVALAAAGLDPDFACLAGIAISLLLILAIR